MEDFKSGVEAQKDTASNLFEKCQEDKKGMMDLDVLNEDKVKNLCNKHAELINDFEVLKEMNRAMSMRFDEVTQRFPTANELDLAITNLNELYDAEEAKLRRHKLMSFRKICEALEDKSEKIRPKSYEESVDTQEVKNG